MEALTEAIQEVNDDGSLGSSASPSERLNLFIRKLSENKLNGMKVRQDTEVMTALIGILQDDSDHSDSQIVEVLEQLEGFVHQVDNAVDLHAMGKLSK